MSQFLLLQFSHKLFAPFITLFIKKITLICDDVDDDDDDDGKQALVWKGIIIMNKEKELYPLSLAR
jgi:hypothetical protein